MSELILIKEDHESVVSVKLGDSIKIVLAENATTGYSWHFDNEVSNNLRKISDDYQSNDLNALGGSGKRVFVFIAERRGESQLKLKYWQEWNGDDSIDDQFLVNIIVE